MLVCKNNTSWETTLVLGKDYELLGEDKLRYCIRIRTGHVLYANKTRFYWAG
jgi:hypothetical protein